MCVCVCTVMEENAPQSLAYPALSASAWPSIAPPHAPTETDESESESVSARTFYVLNPDCLLCDEKLRGGDRPVALLACGHAYHVICGEGLLELEKRKAGDGCSDCNPQPLDLTPDDDDDDETQKEPDADTDWVEFYESEYDQNPMKPWQEKKLLGGAREYVKNKKAVWFGRTPEVQLDVAWLAESEYDLDGLYDLEIGLLALYFEFGVTQWTDLAQLGLTKEHLFVDDGKFLPMGPLIQLYHVRCDDLVTLAQFELEDFSRLRLQWQGLKALGIDFAELERMGVAKDTLASFDLEMSGCIKGLGMTKKHAFRMGLTGEDMRKMGWNPLVAAKLLKLSRGEMSAMYIDAPAPAYPPVGRGRPRENSATSAPPVAARRAAPPTSGRVRGRGRGRSQGRGQGQGPPPQRKAPPGRANGVALPIARRTREK